MSNSMAVHNQWRSRPSDERFDSLYAMRDFKRAIYSTATEFVTRGDVIAKKLACSEDVGGRFDTDTIGIEAKSGDLVQFNNWSFGQLATLSGSPASYLRELPAQLVRDNLRWMLRNRAEDLKCYGFKGDTPHVAAFTGPNYGRIYDADIIDALIRIAGDGIGSHNWRVPGVWNRRVEVNSDTTTLYASDRDMFVFLVDEDHPIEVGKTKRGEPRVLRRGFYITNSEVGASSLVLACFYYNEVCANRIIWGIENFEEFRFKHSKFAPNRFINHVQPALTAYSNKNTVRIGDAIREAESVVVAKKEDEAIDWLRKRDFTQREAKSVVTAIRQEEGGDYYDLWNLAQGVTAVARDIPHQDQRVKFEQRASTWLNKVAA